MQGRILVVHRNELILDVIREMLQDLGYAVTQAKDGHRALGKALSSHYHLIIVNHALNGGLTGSQLVARMKKYGVRAPIIGTAPNADWDAPLGFAEGTVDYLLPSPFDYAELIKAVESLSNAHRTTPVENAPIEEDVTDALPALPESPSADLDLLEAMTEEVPPLSSPIEPPSASFNAPDIHPSELEEITEEPIRTGAPRVLVVETDRELCNDLRSQLVREGFEVAIFHNGSEAYEDTMLNNYDMILTDLWLPGLDGFDMIDAMRKSGVRAPIAILTAHITREMVQELIAYRICRILLKPLETDDLMALIHAKAM